VVRAVDFAQQNGDVSDGTVGRSEWRGTVTVSTLRSFSDDHYRDILH